MTAVRCGTILITLVFFLVSSSLALDREKLRWVRSKPLIMKISIEGNDNFSDGEIRKQMYSKLYGFWGSLRRDRQVRVQRETLGRDTLEIKFLYLKSGFLDVSVEEEFQVNELDSSAIVSVRIDEGRRYRFGEKTATGHYEGRFQFGFDKMLRDLKRGKPFNLFAVRSVMFDMKTILANEGYPYAKIDYRINSPRKSGFDDLTIVIDSDSLVHFGDVTITGNNNFPGFTAQRELKIETGNIYRREDLLDSQRRLLESGYYSTVRFQQEDTTEDRLHPDFVLTVRERKPHYATVTTGAGQSEDKDLVWGISGGLGKRNFFGSRRYDLLADYSFTLGPNAQLIEHRYRGRFTEPWFLGFRMPLILTTELQPKLKDPNREFDRESWSVSVETTRRFGLKVRTSLGIEYEFVKISGVPDSAIELLKREEGNSARRKIFGIFRRDSRDDLFIPRRGVVTDIKAQYFGGFLGGDENFAKIQLSWSTYQKLKPNWISATRLRGGWAKAFQETQAVPIDEALFLGGANTIRGFSEESLGPIGKEGQAEGATYTIVFNQELRWKTLQLFSYIPVFRDLLKSFPLWQSVFFDMGNGFRDLNDVKFGTFAYSYGTGVQILSPAGPIRIDYAQRIATKGIDFDTRWHFTILYAF